MAIEMTITSGREIPNFVASPIRASWILAGEPVARIALLSSSADGTASTYYWDCTAGRFNWYYSFDETLHILEGSVRLKAPSGSPRTVVAGDTIFFPAGSQAEWTVDEYIRKLAFCRTPLPNYVVSVRDIGRKFKSLVNGGGRQQESSGLL
jgi:uncharacterized cupin superfamily protein